MRRRICGLMLVATIVVTGVIVPVQTEMNAHASPAGFIVLNGTVTEGSYVGAQIHQRSNLVGIEGSTSSWTGELQLMPAST